MLSNLFYKAFAGHGVEAILVPKKITMQADGSWDDPNVVAKMLCDLLGAMHDPGKLNGGMPTFQYGYGLGIGASSAPPGKGGGNHVTRQNGTTPYRGAPLRPMLSAST